MLLFLNKNMYKLNILEAELESKYDSICLGLNPDNGFLTFQSELI